MRRWIFVTIPCVCASFIPLPAAADPGGCSEVMKSLSVNMGSSQRIRASCLRVDARIRVGEHLLVVPKPGTGAGSYVIAAAGAAPSEVEVENVDGVVTVRSAAGPVGSRERRVSALAAPAACADGAKTWNGRRNNGYEYWVNYNGLPSNISTAVWDSEIALAHQTIDTGRNRCGLATGGLDVSIVRKGATGLSAAGTDVSCQGDSYDTIDFGYLPDGVLGRTCARWTVLPFADDRIYEADVRLRKASSWFQYKPSSCSNSYEIAGVLVHEFGHVFGMGHVDENTHGNLTMSTNSPPCSYDQNAWGLGDYNNLHDHY